MRVQGSSSVRIPVAQVGKAGDRPPVISDGMPSQLPDIDPEETSEWLESLDAVVAAQGKTRARYLMLKLLERAREKQVGVPGLRSTDYINTIPPEAEPRFPGDERLEKQIRRACAGTPPSWCRGPTARLASAATSRPTRRPRACMRSASTTSSRARTRGRQPVVGDQVFFQGHASPGIYARAFLEGRLSEAQLDGFRQEVSDHGLPSYPHPRLMPDFWEFPTVSMGLGPLDSIYQARFNRYLHARGIADTSNSHVWAFLGDGEMDEPESLGASESLRAKSWTT